MCSSWAGGDTDGHVDVHEAHQQGVEEVRVDHVSDLGRQGEEHELGCAWKRRRVLAIVKDEAEIALAAAWTLASAQCVTLLVEERGVSWFGLGVDLA